MAIGTISDCLLLFTQLKTHQRHLLQYCTLPSEIYFILIRSFGICSYYTTCSYDLQNTLPRPQHDNQQHGAYYRINLLVRFYVASLIQPAGIGRFPPPAFRAKKKRRHPKGWHRNKDRISYVVSSLGSIRHSSRFSTPIGEHRIIAQWYL